MNVTYISKEAGVTLALSVDHHTYYSKEVSCRSLSNEPSGTIACFTHA